MFPNYQYNQFMNNNPNYNNNFNNNNNFMNNNNTFMNNSNIFMNNNNNFINNSNNFMNNNPFYSNLCNNMGLMNNMIMCNYMMNYLNLMNKMKQMNNNRNKMIFVNTKGNHNSSKSILQSNKANGSCDPFHGYSGEKRNIIFKTPNQNTLNMLVPSDVKIKDLLIQYVLRLGYGPDVIESSLYFICNGLKLKKNENRTVNDLCILNGTVIVVIDKKGIMGA